MGLKTHRADLRQAAAGQTLAAAGRTAAVAVGRMAAAIVGRRTVVVDDPWVAGVDGP